MIWLKRLMIVVALSCTSAAGVPWADAIVMTRAMKASTIAEFFIEENAIRVDLEIGAGGLEAFKNLLPDPLYEKLGHAPEPLEKRFDRFFREDLVLSAGDAQRLTAGIEEILGRPRILRDEISGEPLPAAEDAGEPVVFARLVYPFARRPETLTFAPPRDEGGRVLAEIGFIVYHHGVPVNDFRYLGVNETLRLDWSDPWYSRFDNRNLRRKYDTPLSVFLYVEPYEVRAEVIARPIDLQRWVELGLKGRQIIPIDMQEEVKRKAAAFLAEHVNLIIDGEAATIELDRINFLRRTLRTSTVVNPPEDLSVWSATLGAIYVVPTDGLPQEVNWEWDLFAPNIQTVTAAATDEAGPLRFFLQPQDNLLWWKNFLKRPNIPTLVDMEEPPPRYLGFVAPAGWLAGAIGLLVLVPQLMRARRGMDGIRRRPAAIAVALLITSGATFAVMHRARVDDERAGEVVRGLLHNVYRAFDFREEEAIYDILDRSVAGDLLTQIYLETRRGLELQSQGGARAKVNKIELLEIASKDLGGERGFEARCTWNVSGSVGHWGHIHQRTNQYEADFEIRPVDGRWKITEMEILLEERI
ncbi:MAG: hypothetical protein V3U83_00860 [Acidobacteriota bacterium]